MRCAKGGAARARRTAALALALCLGGVGNAHAVLEPGARAELASALDALARGQDPGAFARAGQILGSESLAAPELEDLLRAFLAERPSTESLYHGLLLLALPEASREVRQRTQQALAGALAGSLVATFDALLPDELGPALAADPALFEDVRTRIQLLAELVWRADELPAATRRALAARLAALVADHPGVLRADARIDVGAQPKLAALRAQLHKILRDLPRPFDADAFVAQAGFVGIHARIVRRHGIVVLDNNGFDLAQLDAIEQVLAAVPAELHRLSHVSQHEMLGNRVGDRVELELRGSVGVNLFATPVYAELENQFPPDVEPRRIRTFCAALQHEINHGVDELSVQGDPVRAGRLRALVDRAGREDPLQYLRSMLPAATFADAPQELFASISNQYLADSVHTLELARARLREGRSAPLDQFLFFAEVYSRGRDSTLFFAQDEECNYSAYEVRVRRDAAGRIDALSWPGGYARFQLDREGWVVR
jgi:hypothetical protein